MEPITFHSPRPLGVKLLCGVLWLFFLLGFYNPSGFATSSPIAKLFVFAYLYGLSVILIWFFWMSKTINEKGIRFPQYRIAWCRYTPITWESIQAIAIEKSGWINDQMTGLRMSPTALTSPATRVALNYAEYTALPNAQGQVTKSEVTLRILQKNGAFYVLPLSGLLNHEVARGKFDSPTSALTSLESLITSKGLVLTDPPSVIPTEASRKMHTRIFIASCIITPIFFAIAYYNQNNSKTLGFALLGLFGGAILFLYEIFVKIIPTYQPSLERTNRNF